VALQAGDPNRMGNHASKRKQNSLVNEKDTEELRSAAAEWLARHHTPPLPSNKPTGPPDQTIQVKVSSIYSEEWGKVRLCNAVYKVRINFSGEIFKTHGSSHSWIENICLTSPTSIGAWEYIGSDDDFSFGIHMRTLTSPPWEFDIGCPPMTLDVNFRINTLCGHSYDFSYRVPGVIPHSPYGCPTLPDGTKPAAPPADFKLSIKTPEVQGEQILYVMKGGGHRESHRSGEDHYFPQEVKILTQAGNPSKVISSWVGLEPVSCVCTASETGFKVTLKRQTQTKPSEFLGEWEGDYLILTWLEPRYNERITAHLPVKCSIIKNQHVLNAIRDLSFSALNSLLYLVAQQVFTGDNPTYIDFWSIKTPISEFLTKLGVKNDSDQAELITILKKMLMIHTKYANWNEWREEGATKSIQEILTNMTDLPDIKYITPQIVAGFTELENQSRQAIFERKQEEVRLIAEPKHFFNAERIHWLIVQKQTPILCDFPIEVVKKIGRMLPPVKHGCLLFCCRRYESFGCGGTEWYSLMTFRPAKSEIELFCNKESPQITRLRYHVEGEMLVLGDLGATKFRTNRLEIHRSMSKGIYFSFPQGMEGELLQINQKQKDEIYKWTKVPDDAEILSEF
jgi:hypothetical protein